MLKKKFDKKNRSIEKNSKRSGKGQITESSKRILKETYGSEMDEVIYNLLIEIYNLYVAIINSSGDIAVIFSPGLNRVEYLQESNFSMEYLHKELLDHIFLQDSFLKVRSYYHYLT